MIDKQELIALRDVKILKILKQLIAANSTFNEFMEIDRKKLLIRVQNGEGLFEISGFSDISTLEMFIILRDYVERDNEFNLVTGKKEKLQWRRLKKGWKND